MGGIMPKVERHKKTPKKDSSPSFSYSNMVRVHQIQTIEDHYTFLEKIGDGTAGKIFRAIGKPIPHVRAVKVIQKAQEGGISSLMEMQFAILRRLDHPNIIKMYQILQTPTQIYQVSELCEGEELFQVLLKVKKFKQKQARQIMFQIVSAVRHMHYNNFMHRDIKPENIIYNQKTRDIKLIDLSSAIFFDSSEPVTRKRIGTSYYIAPEVLERRYNEKCDVWSVGVILYILLCGEPPFSGYKDIDILKNVIKGKLEFTSPVWRNTTQSAALLIKKMINRNIQKRISMEEVMEHQWFKTYLKQRQKEQFEGNFVVNALMNMKKFKEVKEASIQNGVLVFIVNFISQSDKNRKNQLVKSFKVLDLNGDGMLSLQEMTVGIMKYMKISKGQARVLAEKMFQKVDVDCSGYIDYSQFLVGASNVEVAISADNVDLAFDYFDENGDGVISVEEFRSKLGTNVSQQQYKDLIKVYDTNNDGFISREQFRGMMMVLLDGKKQDHNKNNRAKSVGGRSNMARSRARSNGKGW